MAPLFSIWVELMDWLMEDLFNLPKMFLPELPTDSSPDFWIRAVELEMFVERGGRPNRDNPEGLSAW